SGSKPKTKTVKRTYRVQSGDTLSGIAAQLGVKGGWSKLYQLNDDRISDPDLIYVGQKLRLPGTKVTKESESASRSSRKRSGYLPVKKGSYHTTAEFGT